jgi:glycosyltransferase involved in cell wall biosynthesis
VLARAQWHTPWWVSRQHLASRLARRGWSLLYATGPWALGRPAGVGRWLAPAWGGPFDRLPGLSPGELLVDRPGHWPRGATQVTPWIRFHLRRYAGHLGRAPFSARTRRRILFVCHPSFWPLVELLRADRVVYYIHDAYLRVRGAPAAWRGYADALAVRADLVVAAARNMADGLPATVLERLHILPHGVDVDAIAGGANAPCPPDLASIPRPRLGYVGRVNLKTDLGTLLGVAHRRPDWHWAVVGALQHAAIEADAEQRTRLDALRGLDNVHFLGVRDRREIPAYLAHMDVNTIPYRVDREGYWSTSLPTKLYEYLAAGRPVVASALENLLPHSSVLAIARTTDGWVDAIDHAVTAGGVADPARRRAHAAGNSWEDRVDRLEGWLWPLA